MFIESIFRQYRRRKLTRQGYVSARQRSKATREVKMPTKMAGKMRALTIGNFLVLWLVASASIFYARHYRSHDYVVGQIASRDIYSEVPFEYVDIKKTELRREQASRQVPFVYRVDGRSVSEALETLTRLQDAAVSLAENPEKPVDDKSLPEELTTDPKVQKLIAALRDAGMLRPMLSIFTSGAKVNTLMQHMRSIMLRGIISNDLEDTFHAGMTEDDVVSIMDPHDRRGKARIAELLTPEQAGSQISEAFARQYPATPREALRAIEKLVGLVIRPNLNFDLEATTAARGQAAAEVPMVREGVHAGTPLIRRGETISAEDLVKLNVHAAELRRSQANSGNFQVAMVTVCLVFILTLIFFYQLGLIMPHLFSSAPYLCMVVTITVLQVLLTRIATDLYYVNYGASVYLLAVLPFALGPMLLALLVNVRTAVWVAVFTSIIAAMQNYNSFAIFLAGAAGAIAGAVFVQNASKRFHMLRAGFAVAFTVFAISFLHVLYNDIPLGVVPQLLGITALNGVITAMVASTILPIFEYLFGVITNISLLELNDLNHPLLKRLQMEAPGTYHHSLLVATLAEQAATAIGANPLLARVCAYFHDIGKISQGKYFTENIPLTAGRNPHDELQPRMSSLIILNHVKGGLELAAKYKLKKVIREGIAQHHGTSLISYFYDRARQEGRNDPNSNHVEPHNYRYPGPTPTRKEIALISIADACEAAARSLEKPSPQKIHQTVNKIVYGRVKDGQLDNADLTFRELAVAKASIASALGNMLHARVSYDKKTKENDKNSFAEANPDTATAASEKSDAGPVSGSRASQPGIS